MIQEALHRYGYVAIGITLMLESMGAPLPGESMLIAAAIYAAATHRLEITWIIAVAALGAVVGDQLGYALGRWAGHPLLLRWGGRVGLTEARLALGRHLFERHGPKVVFLGRFVAVLRTLVALLAGAGGMEWRRFLVWNTLGGIAWTGLYGMGAYLFGSTVVRLSGPVGVACAVLAASVMLGALLLLRRKERRLTAEAQAQLDREREAAAPGTRPDRDPPPAH